jgi:hypothetical protein
MRDKNSILLDPFIKLAKIRNFQLYVNATCTNAIELAISTFRSKEKTQGYEVYGPLKLNRHDLPEPPNTTFNPTRKLILKFDKPIIYNLLGTHNTDEGIYYLTDVDYIDLLTLLLQENPKFVNFKNYLRQSSLLFIGCSFPDWFLRFFIRFWAGEKMDKALSQQANAVIDDLNNYPKSDRSFFLGNYGISPISADSIDFVDQLFTQIKTDQPEAIQEDVYNNFIFISYCWLDKAKALSVRDTLKNKGIDVWLDEEKMVGDDNIDEKVAKAIEDCSAMVAIVSSSMQKNEATRDPYFLKEWQLATNREKKIYRFFVEDVSESILIPKPLSQYQAAITNIFDRNKLGVMWYKSTEIPRNILMGIKSSQYRESVKDIKFKDF